jgi:hypothetical protein
MSDVAYWTDALRKPKRELDAATRRTAINASAKRFMVGRCQAAWYHGSMRVIQIA